MFLGLVAITFTEAQPSVQFVVTSQTISEGIGTYQFAVSIANPDVNPTSVDINVVGGNAVYGTNFTYGPVTVTFPASTPFDQFFTVTVIDDSTIDGDKSVSFGLANPTNNATIGTNGQTTLTMVDVDTPKINIVNTSASVNENAGTVNVSVALSRGVRDTTKVQVKLIPTGTTAVNGVDFAYTDTTLVWPPDSAGILNAVIPIINNAFYERDRTVELTLNSPTNGAVLLTDSLFMLTIKANSTDSIPGCSNLFFGQYIEGTGNNKAITQLGLTGTIAPLGVYILANTGASAGIISVANATSSLLSFDGTDAVALLHLTDTIDVIGQLHTNPGGGGWAVTGGTTVQHTLIRNYYDHAGDSSWINASSSWNAFPVDMIDSLGFHHTQACGLNGPVATVRFITAYDSVLVAPQPPWYILSVVVEVNNPTSGPVNFAIAYNDSNSTAKRGLAYDYQFINDLVSNGPGISYDTAYVYILPNSLVSPVKSVQLQFSNLPSNMVAIRDSIHMIYIINPNIFSTSFLGAGYSYPKGSGLVQIPVVINAYTSEPTSVDVTLSTGSGVLGQDFLFNDTTVTFPAFSIDTQGVWVNILDNNVYESNKQVNFNLTNVTNGAVLGISAFTLTIINNDSLAGGVSSVELNSLKVFPNPVMNALSIKTDEVFDNVEIVDLLGNAVMTIGRLSVGITKLDVGRLSPGIYVMRSKKSQHLELRFVKTD